MDPEISTAEDAQAQRRERIRRQKHESYLRNKERQKANRVRKPLSEVTKLKDAARKKAWREKNRGFLSERDRLWREQNADRKRANDAAYQAANREKLAEQAKARYEESKRKDLAAVRAKRAAYYQANKERAKECSRKRELERRLLDPEGEALKRRLQHAARIARQRAADPAGYAERQKAAKARRLSTPKPLLDTRMGRLMYASLRSKGLRKGKRWSALAGYSIDELRRHLAKTMPSGYTWDDYIAGRLHVDHIVPISVFNYSSPDDVDFKRCWAMKNLQLLPARENISKGAKLLTPFQPSLL